MTVGGRIVVFGAICAGLAVGIGAFGAHALEGRVSADMLGNFETAARYHFYHALGMLAVGALALIRDGGATTGTDNGATDRGKRATADPVMVRLRWAATFMLTGIVLFSGSLYTMALSGETWLGAITPLGGVAFLAGWGALAWAGLES